MKPRVLADSGFFIGPARKRRAPFHLIEEYRDRYEFLTCGMVEFEVLRGIRDTRARQEATAHFAQLHYQPMKRSTWAHARDIAQRLDEQGTPIPPQDTIIAACALEARAAVLTNDQHFLRIPGLLVLPFSI